MILQRTHLLAALVLTLGAGTIRSQEDDTKSGKLRTSVEALDFGRVTRGQTVTKEVELSNVGDQPLRLRKINVDTEAVRLKLSTPTRLNVPIQTKDEGKTGLVLQPGEFATLQISVDTSKLSAGESKHQCFVYSSQEGRAKTTIPFSMDVRTPEKPAAGSQPASVPFPGAHPEGGGPAEPIEAMGQAELDRTEHDFGEVLRGDTPTTTFEIKNTHGEQSLTLHRLKNSCSCTASRMWIGDRVIEGKDLTEGSDLGVLAPGESARVEVKVETAATAYRSADAVPLRKSVSVFHSDGNNNPSTLTFSAQLLNPVTIEPVAFRFGRVRRSSGEQMTVTITPDHISDFQVVDAVVPNEKAVVARVLPPEGDQTDYRVQVTLKPGAPVGPVTGNVIVHFEHPRVHQVMIPIYLDVSPDVTFTGNGPALQERLDFGILTGEEPKTVELVIENFDPEVPYVPTMVTLSAKPTAQPFQHELVEVEAGKKYILRLTASTELEARYFSGKVKIESNHPDVPEKFIDFRGWIRKNED